MCWLVLMCCFYWLLGVWFFGLSWWGCCGCWWVLVFGYWCLGFCVVDVIVCSGVCGCILLGWFGIGWIVVVIFVGFWGWYCCCCWWWRLWFDVCRWLFSWFLSCVECWWVWFVVSVVVCCLNSCVCRSCYCFGSIYYCCVGWLFVLSWWWMSIIVCVVVGWILSWVL